MSRTIKGSKDIGDGYGSRRPPGGYTVGPGKRKYGKKLTHRLERCQSNKVEEEELKDYAKFKGRCEKLCEDMITGEKVWMPVEVDGRD